MLLKVRVLEQKQAYLQATKPRYSKEIILLYAGAVINQQLLLNMELWDIA